MTPNLPHEDLLDSPCTLTRIEVLSIIHAVDRGTRLIADIAHEHLIPRWEYDEDLRFEELQGIKRTCLAALNQTNLLDLVPPRPTTS